MDYQLVGLLVGLVLGLAIIPHTPPPYAAMDYIKCNIVGCEVTND